MVPSSYLQHRDDDVSMEAARRSTVPHSQHPSTIRTQARIRAPKHWSLQEKLNGKIWLFAGQRRRYDHESHKISVGISTATIRQFESRWEGMSIVETERAAVSQWKYLADCITQLIIWARKPRSAWWHRDSIILSFWASMRRYGHRSSRVSSNLSMASSCFYPSEGDGIGIEAIQYSIAFLW